MTITITDTDSSASLVLCHGPSDTGAADYAVGPLDNLNWSDETNIQVAERLRGTAAAIYQRGNIRARCEFTVARTFASTIAAQSWLASHITGCPRRNQLAIAEGATTVTLKGALGPIRYESRGIAIILRYSFLFSEVS